MESKPADEFAKNVSRGKPIVTLCRLCVAEQAKLSVREHRYPQYVREMRKSPDAKLISEAAWLQAKLDAVKAELQRRDARFLQAQGRIAGCPTRNC
jgi:hypothetical protein